MLNNIRILLYKFIISIIISNRRYRYDKRGVRTFVCYANGNGCWRIELYRKKTKQESKGETDWQMVREGHIMSYGTRLEAELKSLELAKNICEDYGL